MANQKPFFINGANAIITLNGSVIGFATDVSYRVSVRHETPRLLGRFEHEAPHPTAYMVTGSFTMIRYAKGLKGDVITGKTIKAASPLGNSIGNFSDPVDSGKAEDSLVPSKLIAARTFDISIWQKAEYTGQEDLGALSGDNICEIARLRGCRITEADFSISKKSLARQRFNFMAQYADEDGFIAEQSGVGQQLVGLNKGD